MHINNCWKFFYFIIWGLFDGYLMHKKLVQYYLLIIVLQKEKKEFCYISRRRAQRNSPPRRTRAAVAGMRGAGVSAGMGESVPET